MSHRLIRAASVLLGVIGACGALLLWLGRALRRFSEPQNAVKPTLVA